MVLGDVSSWDGRTLMEREQQIRQAALILTGQCIAREFGIRIETKKGQTR